MTSKKTIVGRLIEGETRELLGCRDDYWRAEVRLGATQSAE
jgi:hypothetical protein